MKLLRKKYSINLDGEIFFDKKSKFKILLLKKAKKYYVAGEKSAKKCGLILNTKNAYPYYFSSLKEEELRENKKNYIEHNKENYILIVGRYIKVKGLDIALNVAKMNNNIIFKFVGMGKEGAKNLQKKAIDMKVGNIEIIPFLEKKELDELYKNCRCLLMPSIQECWGLVINEAASFGTPIVATRGSGAAMEFLQEKYGIFLAIPNNAEDLNNKLNNLLNYNNLDEYKKYLIEKSQKYSIEKSAENYIKISNL